MAKVKRAIMSGWLGQRCVDPQMLNPYKSADFHQRSAIASVSKIVRYIGPPVSPRQQYILPNLLKDTAELIADLL